MPERSSMLQGRRTVKPTNDASERARRPCHIFRKSRSDWRQSTPTSVLSSPPTASTSAATCHHRRRAKSPESRLRKFEQDDKWKFLPERGDNRREQERP